MVGAADASRRFCLHGGALVFEPRLGGGGVVYDRNCMVGGEGAVGMFV